MHIINGLTDFNTGNVVDLAALRAVNLAPSAPAQPTTVEEWAEYIRGDLQTGATFYISAGRKLIAAKKALRKGNKDSFLDLVTNRLGWNIDSAERWMQIARNPVLSDSATLRNLPTAWTTLWQLSRLPQKVLEAFIEDSTVHPALSCRAAAALVERELKKGHRADRKNGAEGDCHTDHGDDNHGDGDRGDDDRGDDGHEENRADAAAEREVAQVDRNDIGPTSRGEIERLRARAEELEREVRVRDVRIRALEAEIENLRAAANLSGVDIAHQRRQFHKALRASVEAEQPGLVEKERNRLRSRALTDFVEVAQSLTRDGLKADRLDLIYRPESTS